MKFHCLQSKAIRKTKSEVFIFVNRKISNRDSNRVQWKFYKMSASIFTSASISATRFTYSLVIFLQWLKFAISAPTSRFIRSIILLATFFIFLCVYTVQSLFCLYCVFLPFLFYGQRNFLRLHSIALDRLKQFNLFRSFNYDHSILCPTKFILHLFNTSKKIKM